MTSRLTVQRLNAALREYAIRVNADPDMAVARARRYVAGGVSYPDACRSVEIELMASNRADDSERDDHVAKHEQTAMLRIGERR